MQTTTEITPTTRPRGKSRRLTLTDWIKRLRADNPDMKAINLRVIAAAELHEHRNDPAWQDIVAAANDALVTIHIVDVRAPRAPNKTNAERAEQRAGKKAEFKERLDNHIQNRVIQSLLGWETELGKPLGDCTGADCSLLMIRAPAFYGELVKGLTPGEHVRVHFTEDQLQSIWRASRLGPKS